MKLKDVFKTNKPIIGVLHAKGDSKEKKLELAKKEIDIYREHGVDGIIVENYFGDEKDAEMILKYVSGLEDVVYGIGLLGYDALSFKLAEKYHASFVQIDSVASHLPEKEDEEYGKFLEELRRNSKVFLLGGVRFKYQPYLSGRTLEEDLKIGMQRCDAICVTQDKTGQETDMEKIKKYRSILQDFPLVVAAGLTPSNVKEQLSIADGGVVGSYFKDTFKDTGDVDSQHVEVFMEKVRALRDGEAKII